MDTVIGGVMGGVVEYIVKPILDELSCLFHYNENIEKFEEKLKILETTEDRVQIFVSQERDEGNAIFDDVTKWLAKVKEEMDMANENKTPNISCFNCVRRHQISRKAKKRLEKIIELIDEGKRFDHGSNIGYHLPFLPQTTSSTRPEDYQIFESRTSLCEKIKDALAKPNVNKVGVCGMGGVGKSTLLNEVKKLEKNLFDWVIVVEVGQSKSVIQIQKEIRVELNKKLEQGEKVRSSRGQTHVIVEKKKNILFILDDLWKKYDVENEFVIPCCSELRIEGTCKILVIGRLRDLFTNHMDIKELIEVNCLTEEESWSFFVTIVGDQLVEDEDIQQVGKHVVKECGGLPIALKIIATILKGKRVEIWKDALNKLKNPVVVDIPGVSDQLYSCLQFSYNSIEDEAQLLLLLCSVFPDDALINVKDLQMYAMGMGLLNHVNTWNDARNRVIKLVDDLKSSYLLQGDHDYFVQMHDVVHDFAKYTASKKDKMTSLTYKSGQSEWEEEDRHGSYNAIYQDCTTFLNLPTKLEFPNLQLFILINIGSLETDFQISDTFFEGMEKLQVLRLSQMSFAPSSWTSLTHSLKNLQTFCLSNCYFVDIDTIGKLKKLKILKISSCEIEELPVCMRELTQLKVLHVSFCDNLKVIHPDIISKLTRLEELCFHENEFEQWGEEVSYKNKLITNAKLSELNCLKHLSCLTLRIQNVEILSNELSLETTRNLKEFNISTDWIWERGSSNAILKLAIKSPIDSIGGVLQILLQKCKYLTLDDSVGFTKLFLNPHENYIYPRVENLKLYIRRRIGNLSPHNFNLQVAFPRLETLHIFGGNHFETLWHNNVQTPNSLCKLKHLEIQGCNKLTYVFPSCMVRSRVSLITLRIRQCELLERIFEIDQVSIDDVNQAVQSKYSTNLNEVVVLGCPELKTLFPASFINHMKEIEILEFDGKNGIFGETDEASQLVSSETVIFPSLRKLSIHCKVVKERRFWVSLKSFPRLEVLRLTGSKDDGMISFPLEMSELLTSVEDLYISNAFELVQVFQNGEYNNNNNSSGTCAKLKSLRLFNLASLTQVWEENSDDQMTSSSCSDSLETIYVERCENLKCLVPSSITFFNLTSVRVEDCNGMMNLFDSYSVAKNLVNLERIKIKGCREMRHIVVAPEGGEEIIFNRLIDLMFDDLPRLVSFHSGKCMLKFPCLKKLCIKGCLEMKTFNSYGMISTPKLSHMETEEDIISVSPSHGLNVIIEEIWNDGILRSIKNLFTQHRQG